LLPHRRRSRQPRIRTFTPELANDKYGINHVPGHDFHAGACTGVGATGASTK